MSNIPSPHQNVYWPKWRSIGESLANGSAKLSDEGLFRYLQAVEADLANDIKYKRRTNRNSTFVKAAKHALRLRGLA